MKDIRSVENIVHGFRAYSTFSGLKSSLTKCEVTGISVLNGNKAASKLKLIPLHLTLKSFGKFLNFTVIFYLKEIWLILFRMGLFGAAHLREEEGEKDSVPKTCHKYVTMIKLDTGIPYLMKILKTYKSHDTPLEFCWHQHFFTGNYQIFVYQEIQIQTAFWCIISNSFNFFWVFKGCFNKQFW